jgi:hypothetical protein
MAPLPTLTADEILVLENYVKGRSGGEYVSQDMLCRQIGVRMCVGYCAKECVIVAWVVHVMCPWTDT